MKHVASVAAGVLLVLCALAVRPPGADGAPATTQAAAPWTLVYSETGWYGDYKQPEQVFAGVLMRHKEPGALLARNHIYKLGTRLIFPGREHPELEKLIDQKVEIRGKPYSTDINGAMVQEIWPGAIRPAGPPSTQPAKAYLAGRAVDAQGSPVAGALVVIYLDRPADDGLMKVTETTTRADGKFEVDVPAVTGLIVDISTQGKKEIWVKKGVKLRVSQKLDLGDAKLAPPPK